MWTGRKDKYRNELGANGRRFYKARRATAPAAAPTTAPAPSLTELAAPGVPAVLAGAEALEAGVC